MTDEEIVAAFRDLMASGYCGDRELLMPAEQDCSGMWSAVCAELTAMEERFGWDNPVVFHLRTRLHQIADARPDAVRIFALATTRYGREEMEGA